MRKRAWSIYLAGGLVLSLLYYVGPQFVRTGPVMNIIGGSAAAAILIGVRLHRPRMAIAWYLFCVGLVFFVAGDVITYNYQRIFHTEAPFPSIGDAMYLAVYPVLIAGLIILVRSRNPGRDRAALIDALVITIGIGVLSWVFLMAPNATDAELNLLQKATSIAYPLGDLLLGGMISASASAGGPNPRLLPVDRQRGGAAADGLEVRLHPGHQHVQRVGERVGPRMAALLPAVGRRRPAPLDAIAVRARRICTRPLAAHAPRPIVGRDADGPGRCDRDPAPPRPVSPTSPS